MKLIVGLGNPGRKYEQTRHNVGFIVCEKVAVLTSAGTAKTKFEGELVETSIAGQKVAILCPQTFMNASGRSVRKAVDFYKLDLQDLLVVCDDLNLPSGRLRIRPAGSAGGQNGIKDTIRHLGCEAFPRLRVGIGRPPEGWTVTDYVLGKFSKSEQEQFEAATTRAAHAAISFVTDGMDRTMSQYNNDPRSETNRNESNRSETKTKKPKTKQQPTAKQQSLTDPIPTDSPSVNDTQT